jgi:hypothetical protein
MSWKNPLSAVLTHSVISASRLDSVTTQEFHAATSRVKTAAGELLLSEKGQGQNQKRKSLGVSRCEG